MFIFIFLISAVLKHGGLRTPALHPGDDACAVQTSGACDWLPKRSE